MKNLIYQYWQGPLKPGVQSSTKLMKAYAEKIGAEYRFDHNIQIASKTCNVPIYYEPANPLVDSSFDKYDNVALIDIDVFPVENLEEDLFEAHNGKDIGICTEPLQPHFRSIYNVANITSANDKRWCELLEKRWGIKYSYDKNNLPKVFNTGVMVFSKEGLRKAKAQWPSFQEYIDFVQVNQLPRFYFLYQDYASAFMHYGDIEFEEMNNGWNSYMHKLGSKPNAKVNDTRTEETKFVHIMFRTADDWPEDALWGITNKPIKEWKLPVAANWPND
tara:strand:+ start:1015 stop:1839 length:825 start_codon:yes stop_codon:yes gene_type:complete